MISLIISFCEDWESRNVVMLRELNFGHNMGVFRCACLCVLQVLAECFHGLFFFCYCFIRGNKKKSLFPVFSSVTERTVILSCVFSSYIILFHSNIKTQMVQLKQIPSPYGLYSFFSRRVMVKSSC